MFDVSCLPYVASLSFIEHVYAHDALRSDYIFGRRCNLCGISFC